MKRFILLVSSIILTASLALSQTYVTTSDSVKLYAKTSGNGPICIFIHGGPGAWSKSFEEMKGNSLEQKLRMVYLDQRGCGRSDTAVDQNYALDRMIEDIEDVRRFLGVEKVYLLAHSFGGIIAVSYAKKHPDHLYGLIFTNSTLDMNYSLKGQIKHVNELLKTDFTVTNKDSVMSTFLEARSALSKQGLNYKMLSDNKRTVALLDSIDNSYNRTTDFAKHLGDYKIYSQNFTNDTKGIKVPVLVITGKKDYAIGVDHYNLFKFPNQKIVHINGGHVLYYEQNKEFTRTIFSFIAQH